MKNVTITCTYSGTYEMSHDEKFIFDNLGIFPHCDSRVLHAPGKCSVCDERKDWQALRMHWNINFTGENNPDKKPCPAERYRSAETIHRWHGNRPCGK